jgi:[protein-PII] uridylyltransferase
MSDTPSPTQEPSLPAVSAAARAELSELTDEKAIAAWLVRERQILIEHWTPEHGGRVWMHAYSGLLDTVVRRLFALSLQRTQPATPENGMSQPHGIAILAVGGYGQRLCAPHSDLDLTFLSERDDDPPVLHQMFPLVMDVLLSGAKIKVGYAYRTLADIRAETLDHHTQTALLDARLVTGDAGLFQLFQNVYAENLQIADFLFRKEAERSKVRARWGNSAFIVEPNVKEGVGGLRGIQTAAWMARVRFGKGGDALWRDLLRRRVITKADLHTLSEARELLLSTRCALHLLSGERRDVLTARRQEEVAARLELGERASADLPVVETFMERYYHAVYNVQRISDKVMARCLDAPLPLGTGTGLSSVRRTVAITDPAQADADPLWPMIALQACQEHGLELALPTDESLERLVASWHIGSSGENLPAGFGPRFLELLIQPGNIGATLRRMERTTLLSALLPELDRCMALIPYDSSHSHTVGEHSIRVLENLIRLRDHVADGDPALGGYLSILQMLASPLPLFLAALLHDIGKQWTHLTTGERGPHEETGGERVRSLCLRLGCTENVAEQVEFLVRNHLLLARISRLRDLTQPSTLREVIRVIGGDRERLRMLYLLTWADTAAVGPGVWTDMSARLLDELFARTDEALEGSWYGPETAAPETPQVGEARLDTVRERLHRQLTQDGKRYGDDPGRKAGDREDDAIRAHIQLMPAVYLLNTPPGTIALQVSLIERLRESGGVVVDMRTDAPGAAQTEMTVVTRDAPGLFSRITGALFACDVRLHRAQAFTRPFEDNGGDEIVIDTLTVDHRDRPLGPERRRIVEDALRQVLGEEKTVAQLLVQRRRGIVAQNADVILRTLIVDDQTSSDYTLVDIEAPDETGITYRLAALFSGFGWNIHAARVSTWGGNARCAFYLTDGSGGRLEADTVRARLQPLVHSDGLRRIR